MGTAGSEPRISVGISLDSSHKLEFSGDYRQETSESGTLYIPSGKSSYLLLPEVRIGIGFHWERKIPFLLSGIVEVRNSPEGVLLINTLPLERYLEGVVSSEMSPDAPLEFLKAHAVISRSWALRILKGGRRGQKTVPQPVGGRIIRWEDSEAHKEFDVCAGDHCQRYQGEGAVNDAAREAVASTAGLVLMDRDGDIADARFSKCCGSHTEIFSTCWQDEDYAYLCGKEDPYCNPSRYDAAFLEKTLPCLLKDYDRETAGYFEWHRNVDPGFIRDNILRRYGLDVGTVRALVPLERGASGRIRLLRVEGDRGSVEVGKELEIRRLLSSDALKSSWFDVVHEGDSFSLSGHGWGHGVGLCQIGAALMAAEGASHEDILEFYYPGTELRRAYIREKE